MTQDKLTDSSLTPEDISYLEKHKLQNWRSFSDFELKKVVEFYKHYEAEIVPLKKKIMERLLPYLESKEKKD